MAIETLTPSIRVCISNQCKVIKVYDTTKEYNVDTNTGGWGAPNVTTADIDEATLNYITPDGTSTTLNVLADVQSVVTVTDEFLIAEIDISAADGTYEFLYTLTNVDGSVVASKIIFSLCVVRCCVDKLWAKASSNLESDCGCEGKVTGYTEIALQAESLFSAIKFSTASGNISTRDNLLKKLQRICSLENCNCN